MKDIIEETKSNPRAVTDLVVRGGDSQLIHALGEFEYIHRTLRRHRALK
jgi:hypothetical protein